MPTTRQGMGSIEIEELIAQRVADAMTTYKANRNIGNGVHYKISASVGGVKPTPRGCSFKDFLNCKPINFNGTKRVKMENELWNLTVKGTHVIGYTKRFQELAQLCPGMVMSEEKKIEWYITSSKPTKIQEAVRMAHDLMD
ncbi:reverse transcriptase domain-containing protein [Tanacetum coccineum]